MHIEAIIFFVFMGLQICFHNFHRVSHLKIIKKISEHHWVVWLFHPVVAHTFQDYAIHLFIYSGRIISGH